MVSATLPFERAMSVSYIHCDHSTAICHRMSQINAQINRACMGHFRAKVGEEEVDVDRCKLNFNKICKRHEAVVRKNNRVMLSKYNQWNGYLSLKIAQSLVLKISYWSETRSLTSQYTLKRHVMPVPASIFLLHASSTAEKHDVIITINTTWQLYQLPGRHGSQAVNKHDMQLVIARNTSDSTMTLQRLSQCTTAVRTLFLRYGLQLNANKSED